jgi:hypothetical protein
MALSSFGREKTLLKRRDQLDDALQRARAHKLPLAIVALYEATVAAHQAVAREYENLAAAADRIFTQAASRANDTQLAAHRSHVAAFERDAAAFAQAEAQSRDPQSDSSLRQQESDLIKRAAALEIERSELLKANAAYGGIVNIFDRLQQKLKNDVIEFDLGRALKQLGGDASTAAITIGADVVAPGSGVILAGSNVVDRLIDGQMVEDEKAQHHYLWLDTYRRAAEDWARLAHGVLEFGESA